MPSEQVGAAYAVIGLDSEGFDSDLEGSQSKFFSVAEGIESRAKSMAGAIVGYLAPIAGALSLGESIKSVADFQEEVTSLGRASQLSAAGLKTVTDANRDMSTQFSQSRESLDSVSTSLAAISKTPEGITALTQSVAQLSEISGTLNTDLAETDKQIGKIWGEGVPGIMKLNDGAIALKDSIGADESKTLDFVAAFGPLAQTVGVSTTQAEALGATFQHAGIDGTDAIQAIYTGTNNLIKNVDSLTSKQDDMTKGTKKVGPAFTDAALQAQQKLGDIGRVFGETGEQIKADLDTDYVGTLIKLGAHLRENAGDTAALQAATELFGTKGVKALMALGNSTDTYNAALKLLGDNTQIANDKQKDLTEKAAEIWTKVGNVIGAAKDVALSFGESLEPYVGPVLDSVLSIEKSLDDVFRGRSDWSEFGRNMYDGIRGGAAKLWDMGVNLLSTLKATNWTEVGTKLAKNVISALSGLGTYVVNIFKETNWSDIANSIMSGLKSAFDLYYSYYSTIGTELYNAISKVDWSSVGTKILDSLKSIGSEISGVFTGINWGDISSKIKTAIQDGISGLTSIGTTIWNNLNSLPWGQLGESVGAELGSAVKSALNILSSIGNTIKGYVESGDFASAGSSIADKIKGGIATVTGWMDRVKDGFLVGWGDTGSKIGDAIKSGIGTVTGWYESAKKSIQDWVAGDEPKNLGESLADAMISGIKGVWSAMTGGSGDLWGTIKSVLGEAASWGAIGLQAAGSFVIGFTSKINKAISDAIVGGIMNGIAQGFENFGQSLDTDHMPGGDMFRGWATEIRTSTDKMNNSDVVLNPSTGQSAYVPAGSETVNQGTYTKGASNAVNVTENGVGVIPDGGSVTKNGITYTNIGGVLYSVAASTTEAPSQTAQSTVQAPTTTAEVTQNDYTAQAKRLITGQTSASSLGTQTANAGYTKEEMLSALEGQIGSYGTLQQQADLAKTEKEFSDAYDAAIAAQKKTNTETTAAASDLKKVADTMPNTASDAAKTTTGAAKTVANMMPQSATTAGEVTYKYSKTAAEALTLGGGAVQIGLTASGQELAVIGTVAQQNFTASGGKFVSDTSVAGEGYKTTVLGAAGTSATTTTGAATASASTTKGAATDASATTKGAATTAAGQTTGASSVFQGKVQSGAQIAMDAISKAGDPATKLVIGAQYAAQMIVSAGNVFMNRVGGLNKNSFDVGGYASGTETSGPELALIGEAGKEFVIPTKKKRWDLLLAAMKAYGIRGFAEGGAVGSGSSDADVTKAVASIAVSWDVGKLVSNTEKQLENLQDYFRTTWSLIKLDGQKAWQDLGISIPASVGVLRATVTAQMQDIKNVTIQSWTDLQEGIKGQVAVLWPTIQPYIITVHDNMENSFAEVNSVVSSQMDSMKANIISSLTAINTEWDTEFSNITTSVSTMSTAIDTLSTSLRELISLVQQLNSLGISLGGSGSGVSSSGSGSDSGGWLGTDSSQSASDSSTTVGTTGDITDMTCTGAVSINAGTYTSPTGQVTQFNPMTYNDTGLTALTSSLQKTVSSVQATISSVQTTVSQYAAFANSTLTGYNTPGGYAAAGGISVQRYGLNTFGDAIHSDEFASWGKYAGGGLVQEHSMIEVGESGPEMVLPTNLTKTILSLADAGLGSSAGNNGGMSDDRIVGLLQAALSGASITMDGEKVARIVFPKGIKIARNQGGMKTGL